MGLEGHGVEATTTEPQSRGNRLRGKDMFPGGTKVVTIPLLPVFRSLLMIDGD